MYIKILHLSDFPSVSHALKACRVSSFHMECWLFFPDSPIPVKFRDGLVIA